VFSSPNYTHSSHERNDFPHFSQGYPDH